MSCKKILVFPVFFVFFMQAAAVSANPVTYLSMNPNTKFCVSVIFGENGRGEYTLTVDDPGGWVDIHRTSFASGPANPVINPVCFSTKNRRVGDEALIKFSLETPEGVIRRDYGVCVSRHEDADVVESSENPCRAASWHTDLFSMDLLQSEIFSAPGEKVTFSLFISSDFDLRISLDKESGPAMQIGKTVVETPGDHMIAILIDSPQQPGDYVFTLAAKAGDCDYPSCEKKVGGILHVSTGRLESFRVELSPKNKDVTGTQAATFFLAIQNLESDQFFNVGLDLDTSLTTDFSPERFRLGSGQTRNLQFTVIPKSSEHRLYSIRAEVEGEVGGKKVAESFLTIQEPVADLQRIAENDPGFRSTADDYADRYSSGANLQDWKDARGAAGNGSNNGGNGGQAPVNWIFIVVLVLVIAAVIFYVYRKTTVVHDTGRSYLGYDLPR